MLWQVWYTEKKRNVGQLEQEQIGLHDAIDIKGLLVKKVAQQQSAHFHFHLGHQAKGKNKGEDNYPKGTRSLLSLSPKGRAVFK